MRPRFAAAAILITLWSRDSGPPTHPTGQIVASPSLAGEPYGVAIAPNGSVLVAQVLAGLVSYYRLPDTLPSFSLIAGDQPVHVAIDPAGERAYVVNQSGRALRVLTLHPFGLLDSIPLTNDGFNVAVEPDGRQVFVTTADGRMYVVSTASDAIVDSMWVGGAANGLAFSPNGDLLYVSSRDAGTITVFNTRTNAPIDTIVATGAPQRLAIAPDGSTLFVANERHESVNRERLHRRRDEPLGTQGPARRGSAAKRGVHP